MKLAKHFFSKQRNSYMLGPTPEAYTAPFTRVTLPSLT